MKHVVLKFLIAYCLSRVLFFFLGLYDKELSSVMFFIFDFSIFAIIFYLIHKGVDYAFEKQ